MSSIDNTSLCDLERETEWRMGKAYNTPFEWIETDPAKLNLSKETLFGTDVVEWGDDFFSSYANKNDKHLPRQSVLFKCWKKDEPQKLYIGGDKSYSRQGKCVLSQARGVGDTGVILYSDHKLFPRACLDQSSDQTYQDFINKKPILVWRGNSTGGVTRFQKRTGIDKFKIDRRVFCAKFNESGLIDAKISTPKKDFMSPQEQHEYKYILSLEGNDSSSNPRWIFSTNSVSFMPEQHTSELTWHYHIKPWLHYVPFEYDLSDIEQKIEWCEAHPKECYDIIQRANEVFKLVTNYSREQRILQLMFERINRNLICDGN